MVVQHPDTAILAGLVDIQTMRVVILKYIVTFQDQGGAVIDKLPLQRGRDIGYTTDLIDSTK